MGVKKSAAISPVTREAWLILAASKLRSLFKRAGLAASPDTLAVSIGWPSRGGLSTRNRTLGQCWNGSCASDKAPAIFLSPVLTGEGVGGSTRMLDVLLHEMIHAALPEGIGHKGPFAKAAKALGLEGKPTHTKAGAGLKAELEKLVGEIGCIPHAALKPNVKHKPQTTRLLKAECGDCGYTVRVTRKWIDVGLPVCPCGTEMVES